MEAGHGAICIIDGAASLSAYPGLATFLIMHVCSAMKSTNFSTSRQACVTSWKLHVKMISLWVKLDMAFNGHVLCASLQY